MHHEDESSTEKLAMSTREMVMARRPRAPQPDILFKDATDRNMLARNPDQSRKDWSDRKDETIDCLVSILRREGQSENDILRVFSKVDPGNRLDWYKHFFR